VKSILKDLTINFLKIVSFLRSRIYAPIKSNFSFLSIGILLIISILFQAIFARSVLSENSTKFYKEGEYTEINIVKETLFDISQSYEDLWYDLREKDFEIYKSSSKGEINYSEARYILKEISYRADVLFAKFLMISKFDRYSQFIKYDILEYITGLLIPTFYVAEAYHLTDDLINFLVVISKNDDPNYYLARFSIYGKYNLTEFKELGLLNEDVQSELFLYNNTWDILYNTSIYGVMKIFINTQMFEAVIERFYLRDLLEVESRLSNFNIGLIISSATTTILSILIGLIKFKNKKFVKRII